ncbi:hypothetical protein V6N11_007676 [Hibiscus sabdariffa]|uniref:Uncharacterized protein n=1 Tax=Hibiscus sabdariffa TaxID=183260 RepID=A0ABR2NJL1_9ROSI
MCNSLLPSSFPSPRAKVVTFCSLALTPMSSAISMQWEATRAAANAIAVDSLIEVLDQVVAVSVTIGFEAASAATAAETPATDTAA